MSSVSNTGKFFEQLRYCHLWVDNNWLHSRQRLQRIIDKNCIKDAERLLADFRTKTRRSAQHLLVQNTAIHAADECEVDDLRNIDAGRQQIDGHRHGWQSIIAEAADQF